MKDKLIFCDDDTCRFNNGIVCTRDEIKIVLKTVGANTKQETTPIPTNIVTIESDDTSIKSSEFEPVKLESVKRTYIEEYEIEEE